VSDYCLMSIEQFFSHTMTRTSLSFWWDDDNAHIIQDQHAELNFYSPSSLKQQFRGRNVAPLGTHYSDSETTTLWSYCFALYHTW